MSEKQPPPPQPDAASDSGDDEALGIMDILEKLGGKSPGARPPSPEESPAEDIETPKGMP